MLHAVRLLAKDLDNNFKKVFECSKEWGYSVIYKYKPVVIDSVILQVNNMSLDEKSVSC